MKTVWNTATPVAIARWLLRKPSSLLWTAGSGASAALVLLSCATTSRTLMVTPDIPGATFVGSDSCAQCHEEVSRDFRTADHARLQTKGKNAVNSGCESCHGPGSKHVEAGGGAGTIINPKHDASACFNCHLDKRAEFSMPYAHPVLSGKMSCSDCHDPHRGRIQGADLKTTGPRSTCAKCHSAQAMPFVFSHDALRDGCGTCHSPHGSVNQKMLIERSSNLCLKCHFNVQSGPTDQLAISGRSHTAALLQRGTCWTSGCHEGVHGSNVNHHLRN
jgi:predicted CXXCH cytochrome family protein